MSNVVSCVMAEPPAGQQSPVVDLVLRQASAQGIDPKQDLLRQLPTELRLMIFEELLVAPKTVFRGSYDFGPLDETEFQEEAKLHWQILLTCWKYYEEAMPIMYSKNRFVFCTGDGGRPGMFWRFPIRPHYMKYLTNIGIYFRADDPKSEASRRVGHFLKALIRHAAKLEHLTVLASSDRHFDAKCPWDIIFGDHPVAVELLRLVEKKPVKHLKIRLHNDALFYPQFACYLAQTFHDNAGDGKSLTFTRSCTCPPGCPIHPSDKCTVCGWDKEGKETKPIEQVVHPADLESGMVRMMEMQDDLFQLGVLPFGDVEDDAYIDEEDEDLWDYIMTGPYKVPLKDIYEESRPAFYSGLIYEDCDTNKGHLPNSLLPGQITRYRGEMKAPKVWYYRQTEVPDFLQATGYADYLNTACGPDI